MIKNENNVCLMIPVQLRELLLFCMRYFLKIP